MSDQAKVIRRVTLVFDVESHSRNNAVERLGWYLIEGPARALDPTTPNEYVTHVETTVVERPQEETR